MKFDLISPHETTYLAYLIILDLIFLVISYEQQYTFHYAVPSGLLSLYPS
jgi:hypothetical protein